MNKLPNKTSIAAILLGLILLAGCHAKDRGTNKQESIDLNKETVCAFAQQIADGIVHGHAEAIDDVFDAKNIQELVSENSIVYSGFDVDGAQPFFDKCLHLGGQFVAAVSNGGDFHFVKHYEKEGEHHIIFRSYDNFNVNFCDFVVDTSDGKMLIEDGFIYNTGCNLSKNIESSMLYNLMLQTNPNDEVQWLMKAENLTKSGNSREALKILTEHKAHLKDYALYYQLYIANLYKDNPKNFISRMEGIQGEIDRRYELLHKLLYYSNEGMIDETESTINELIPHTGDDPIYLLFYGNAKLQNKQYKDALTCFQTAEGAMPLIWDLWYGELQCYKGLNDLSGFQACLDKGKEAYGLSDEELRQIKIK